MDTRFADGYAQCIFRACHTKGHQFRHGRSRSILELGSVAIPERVDDKYFARVELNAQDQQDQGEIFQQKKAVYSASAERKEDQKAVDASVIAAAKKVPHMVNYLGS